MTTPSRAKATSTDVVIAFTGLCLFHQNPDKTVEVYLPTTPPFPDPHHHEARLYVLRDDFGSGCGVEYLFGFPLSSHLDLRLPGGFVPLPSGGVTFPPGVANIAQAVPGATLNESVCDPDSPNAKCSARLTLPPGSWQIFSGGPWSFGGHTSVFLPFCVALTLEADVLPGWLTMLLPLAKGAHRLVVVNVPEEELPEHQHEAVKIKIGQPAEHFHMYYQIVSANSQIVVPTWADSDTCLPASMSCPCHDALPGAVHSRGSFIRCMVAQV